MISRKIGAHVSIAGGMDLAIERAHAIGCNCVQIFSGSPRTWSRGNLSTVPKEKIYSKQQELLVSPIVTHALYLLNIASENEALVAKSIAALEYDMAFDSLVKGSGIVVHLGSDQGRGWEAVREQVAAHIKTIISKSPSDATFLIENSAGQQGKIPSNFEHIRWLLDQVNSPQLGWCFDTCHSFAAGYALGKVGAKEKALIDRNQRDSTAEEAIEKYNLWSSLKCIHVNDSKGALGSGLDRHENLGQGQIPLEDLRYFLNLKQLHDLPLILEVPGYDDTGPDAQNVQFLKDLVTP
jgi:deoxyribonuclease IV